MRMTPMGQPAARSFIARQPVLHSRAFSSRLPKKSAGSQNRGGRFSKYDYGLQWYPTKETLLQSRPGPVLVGTSYAFDKHTGRNPGRTQVMKYSSFDSHWSYWEEISRNLKTERLQCLHEVIPEHSPRCLYFDLDGKPEYRDLHEQLVTWLRSFVHWFFAGSKLGWDPEDPEPVVMLSANPSKYSCHIVFPQIQFANFETQAEYVTVLMTALPALVAELDGGEEVPLLERLVDRVPYTKFQCFRGPYACKMKDGELRPETQFVPESFFENDQRSCFASYVNRDWALELAPVNDLLQWNEELRHHHETYMSRMPSSMGGMPSHQDQLCLYDPMFQQPGGGCWDFAGLPNLEVYEELLRWLHPERAKQFWSWFRICGITFTMLEEYQDKPEARERIWRAHHAWSSRYDYFTESENVEQVEKSRGKRVSGLVLLKKLVRFDNPDMQVRFSTFERAENFADATASAEAARSRIAKRQPAASSETSATTDAMDEPLDGVIEPPMDNVQVPLLEPLLSRGPSLDCFTTQLVQPLRNSREHARVF
mmetsp:Transcript_116921/g.212751  ORF Transcript_116921/g.212751 Transcript_116921/m.212751 type:complete len:538 (+) Transcript_116921:68-1681(+)